MKFLGTEIKIMWTKEVEEDAPYSNRWNDTCFSGGNETLHVKFTLLENRVTNLQHFICKTF